jgi:hypothetical protein
MKSVHPLLLLGALLLPTFSASSCLAIGPKPDDPRSVIGKGTTEIWPKPDDPRSNIKAIGPKPDDPKVMKRAANSNITGSGNNNGLNSGVKCQGK